MTLFTISSDGKSKEAFRVALHTLSRAACNLSDRGLFLKFRWLGLRWIWINDEVSIVRMFLFEIVFWLNFRFFAEIPDPIGGMLLRLGYRYEKDNRTKAHFGCLANQKMPTDSQQVVFQEYINAIKETTNRVDTNRVDRLTKQIETLVSAWRMAPVVTAFQALLGVSLIVATTMVAEVGDLTRF